MGTIYIDSGGVANQGSGTTDETTAPIVLTINAGEAFGDTTLLVDVTSGTFTNIVTSGATQSAIFFNNATNANKKIFWISAIDNVASPKTITVDTIPTGLTAGTSVGYVGGHYLVPANVGLSVIDSASTFRAGDVIIFNNSPATGTQDYITCRASGTSAAGFVTVRGKAGTRPVITVSNTTQCIDNGGTFADWFVSNLELVQQGASGVVASDLGNGWKAYNIKISDGGSYGFYVSTSGASIIACEVSGLASGAGILAIASVVTGNYIHDLTGGGCDFNMGNAFAVVTRNIIDTCTGKGIHFSGGPTTQANVWFLDGNTVYGSGDSGLEITDADGNLVLINNIFSENGNAAGEYNVEWFAGDAEKVSFHGWNVFFHSGDAGGSLLGLAVNAQVASSEFTTDPGFTDAAGGNFAISSTSPAKAAGFPGQFLGGSLGYLDIGAVQRQEPSGGGGGQRVIGG